MLPFFLISPSPLTYSLPNPLIVQCPMSFCASTRKKTLRRQGLLSALPVPCLDSTNLCRMAQPGASSVQYVCLHYNRLIRAAYLPNQLGWFSGLKYPFHKTESQIHYLLSNKGLSLGTASDLGITWVRSWDAPTHSATSICILKDSCPCHSTAIFLWSPKSLP